MFPFSLFPLPFPFPFSLTLVPFAELTASGSASSKGRRCRRRRSRSRSNTTAARCRPAAASRADARRRGPRGPQTRARGGQRLPRIAHERRRGAMTKNPTANATSKPDARLCLVRRRRTRCRRRRSAPAAAPRTARAAARRPGDRASVGGIIAVRIACHVKPAASPPKATTSCESLQSLSEYTGGANHRGIVVTRDS